MRMTPSTAWLVSVEKACWTAPEVWERAQVTFTEYPASSAAWEIASSVRALPWAVRSKLITPRVWNWPVASARAAVLAR